MRLSEIINETQSLDELSLSGVKSGIGKVVGGTARAVGAVAGGAHGAWDAAKQGYTSGRAATSGSTQRPTVPTPRQPRQPRPVPPTPSTLPDIAPLGNDQAPDDTLTQDAPTNAFSDPTKLNQDFQAFSQNITGAQAQQIKPIIKSIWMQLGGTKIEGSHNSEAPIVEFYSKFLGGMI